MAVLRRNVHMYLTYGNEPCPLCGKRHLLREIPRARRLALQVMAQLSTTAQGRIAGGRSQRYMVGVLLAGTTVLLSRSGDRTQALRNAVGPLGRLGMRLPDNSLVPYRVSVAPHVRPPYRSAGGCPIDIKQLEALRPPGQHPQMGSCAAPHLILEALRRRLNLSTCSLSEVWHHPNTQWRTAAIEEGRENYDHGLSAYHCESCRVLIPALLCPSDKVTTAGLIQQHEARIRNAQATVPSHTRMKTDVRVSELRRRFE